MTNHLTQAAAQKCADLANALGPDVYDADTFLNDAQMGKVSEAFRRRLEYYDARDREVLALLDKPYLCLSSVEEVRGILRNDLLTDPEPPTLLEEFKQTLGKNYTGNEMMCVQVFADWIAKRGVEVKP